MGHKLFKHGAIRAEQAVKLNTYGNIENYESRQKELFKASAALDSCFTRENHFMGAIS